MSGLVGTGVSRWGARAGTAVLAAGVALFGLCDAALADAVPSPPTDCPPGSRGMTSHHGTWCEPTVCETDLDCDKLATFWDRDIKKVCREQPLCVSTRTDSGFPLGKPAERSIAGGVCGPETACVSPATCQSAKRCVEPPPPDEPRFACSCRAAGDPGGGEAPPLAFLALAAGVSLVRGRRRKATHSTG